mmetsp:Transcript_10438/g.31018  ORF Transcript_10438/g.31018 Transcript_10438/m.31018 type:complete len:227 (-) Transcript_10438:42-722(-)
MAARGGSMALSRSPRVGACPIWVRLRMPLTHRTRQATQWADSTKSPSSPLTRLLWRASSPRCTRLTTATTALCTPRTTASRRSFLCACTPPGRRSRRSRGRTLYLATRTRSARCSQPWVGPTAPPSWRLHLLTWKPKRTRTRQAMRTPAVTRSASRATPRGMSLSAVSRNRTPPAATMARPGMMHDPGVPGANGAQSLRARAEAVPVTPRMRGASSLRRCSPGPPL